MAQTKYLKGECSHCGGRIEFSPAAAGLTPECPHCGKQTGLLLAHAKEPSGLTARVVEFSRARRGHESGGGESDGSDRAAVTNVFNIQYCGVHSIRDVSGLCVRCQPLLPGSGSHHEGAEVRRTDAPYGFDLQCG